MAAVIIAFIFRYISRKLSNRIHSDDEGNGNFDQDNPDKAFNMDNIYHDNGSPAPEYNKSIRGAYAIP